MATSSSTAQYFDEHGRRVVSGELRVFDSNHLDYYFIKNRSCDYKAVTESYRACGYLPALDEAGFVSSCEQLRAQILDDPAFSALFRGVHVPFVVPRTPADPNLALALVDAHLPFVERAFKTRFPDAHFKAVMQGGTTLEGNLRVAHGSRYERFISTLELGDVFGWYFPQALQQFDISSQVAQMRSLPDDVSICLSGPAEIFSATIGKPELLINEEGYSPILCMSAIEHADDRLALVLKAYGPHLEFWCLSQMLAPGIKQVSEQWSGGITIYCE